MPEIPQNTNPPERMFTIGQAADLLGIPRWKLYRAVKYGLVPCHRILNSRKLVRLSEIEAAIQQYQYFPRINWRDQ